MRGRPADDHPYRGDWGGQRLSESTRAARDAVAVAQADLKYGTSGLEAWAMHARQIKLLDEIARTPGIPRRTAVRAAQALRGFLSDVLGRTDPLPRDRDDGTPHVVAVQLVVDASPANGHDPRATLQTNGVTLHLG